MTKVFLVSGLVLAGTLLFGASPAAAENLQCRMSCLEKYPDRGDRNARLKAACRADCERALQTQAAEKKQPDKKPVKK